MAGAVAVAGAAVVVVVAAVENLSGRSFLSSYCWSVVWQVHGQFASEHLYVQHLRLGFIQEAGRRFLSRICAI